MPIQHWALNMLGYWYTVWKYNLILFHFYLPHTKVVLRSGQRDKSTVVNTTEYYIFFLRSFSFFLNTSRYLFGVIRIFCLFMKLTFKCCTYNWWCDFFFYLKFLLCYGCPESYPKSCPYFCDCFSLAMILTTMNSLWIFLLHSNGCCGMLFVQREYNTSCHHVNGAEKRCEYGTKTAIILPKHLL